MFTASVFDKTGSLFRSYSLQTFDEYKERESQCSRESAVTPEGTLLDYPDLWLRRNPPNVQIDNKSNPTATVITIDSANRPGTLVEVVQCLTELNLVIRGGQISSDGGWFVDVFTVEECTGGKVIDHKKLETIKKVLRIEYECERDLDEIRTPQFDERFAIHTVLELTGEDRVGLLFEIACIMSRTGLDIKSLAAWTQYNRAAAVIGALASSNGPLESPKELALLQRDLLQLLGRTGRVKIQTVRGYIHHERRLHRLLLQEAEHCDLSILLDHPEHSHGEKPEVQVTDWRRLKYWRVNIHCKDRTKLLYDTLCTLSDLGYEVYHASILSFLEEESVEQDFYIRPRLGDVTFCEKKAHRLKDMLISSILRREPVGLKVHILTMDQRGLLCRVADMFRVGNLWLSRAIVKCFTDELGLPYKHAVHTLYLINGDGTPADAHEVSQMLMRHGGQLCTHLTEDRVPHKFNISPEGFAFNIPDGVSKFAAFYDPVLFPDSI
eukprot:g2492.t1